MKMGFVYYCFEILLDTIFNHLIVVLIPYDQIKINSIHAFFVYFYFSKLKHCATSVCGLQQ